MIRQEFLRIVQRNDIARSRDPEAIGTNWISALIQLEAEQDRNDLILLCLTLNRKLKEQANEHKT